jgi:hypothetical protein
VTRLTADIWVAAYLARLRLAAIPAYVMRRGDGTAGAVLVKVATLDGRAQLWGRVPDLMTGARRWERMAEGPEAEMDASVARAGRVDPDLWVIEVEARDGRHLLDEPGLE